MVRDGRLREVEERHQLADADLAGVLAQDVDDDPDRIAERLSPPADPLRLRSLDLRVATGRSNSPTARFCFGTSSRSTAIYTHEYQLNRHLSIVIIR